MRLQRGDQPFSRRAYHAGHMVGRGRARRPAVPRRRRSSSALPHAGAARRQRRRGGEYANTMLRPSILTLRRW